MNVKDYLYTVCVCGVCVSACMCVSWAICVSRNLQPFAAHKGHLKPGGKNGYTHSTLPILSLLQFSTVLSTQHFRWTYSLLWWADGLPTLWWTFGRGQPCPLAVSTAVPCSLSWGKGSLVISHPHLLHPLPFSVLSARPQTVQNLPKKL